MDRLMEANKVANLMRRRELPKPIVPQQAESGSSLERRGVLNGLAMPVRPGIVIRETRIGKSSGKGPRLGRSRRAQIALVRFHVLDTGEKRYEVGIAISRSLGLFLLPRSRRGGMRASDRPAAPSRRLKVSGRRGDMLRVSGNAGFRLRTCEIRHTKPRLVTSPIRPGVRKSSGRSMNREAELQLSTEQWSARRSRLYVARPEGSFCKPWSATRPELREVPGSTAAAGAVPASPVGARVAQVRIELQETMRYAISSEEDRA